MIYAKKQEKVIHYIYIYSILSIALSSIKKINSIEKEKGKKKRHKMYLCNRYHSNWMLMLMVKVKWLHLNEIGLTPPIYRISIKKTHFIVANARRWIYRTFHELFIVLRAFQGFLLSNSQAKHHQHPFHFHVHCTSELRCHVFYCD